MAYPPKRIIKQLLQFEKKGEMNIPTNIGSIYEDTTGRQSGIIDLNRARETPKGNERYLSFVIVDPLRANQIRNKAAKNVENENEEWINNRKG